MKKLGYFLAKKREKMGSLHYAANAKKMIFVWLQHFFSDFGPAGNLGWFCYHQMIGRIVL